MGDKRIALTVHFVAHVDSADEALCGIGCPYLSARNCSKFGRLSRSFNRDMRHWTCRLAKPASPLDPITEGER